MGPISWTRGLTVRPGRRARRIVFHPHDTVVLRRRYIKLSPTECDLLKAIAMSFPVAVSGRELLRATWGQHATSRLDYLKVYIRYLRSKLERNPSAPEVIIAEPGGGYRLTVPPTFL